MIFNLFRKPAIPPDAVLEAYRSIVAQSRQVRFFTEWGIADTVTGRFDMVSLHLALMLRRFRAEPAAEAFAQALVEFFFKDMDRSVRELGVSDLGVPKKVKTMGDIFYGLMSVLTPAIDSADPGRVEEVLVRNIYGAPHEGAAQLARYLIEEAQRLGTRPLAELTFATGAAA